MVARIPDGGVPRHRVVEVDRRVAVNLAPADGMPDYRDM